MSLIKMYSTTDILGDTMPHAYEIDGMTQRKTIVYPEVVYNHFQFEDAVDANNGMQMSYLAL